MKRIVCLCILLVTACGSPKEQAQRRDAFISNLNQKYQWSKLRHVSACAGGKHNQAIRFSSDQYGETNIPALLRSESLHSALDEYGFKEVSLHNPAKSQTWQVPLNDFGDTSASLSFDPPADAAPKKRKRPGARSTKIKAPYKLNYDDYTIQEKLHFIQYGYWGSFSNVLKRVRSLKRDQRRAISNMFYSWLSRIHKGRRNTTRMSRAGLLKGLIQGNHGAKLVRKVMKSEKTSAAEVTQAIVHIRFMKRKSYKDIVRHFVSASDSELAKESVITCYEFADRKCIASIEKMMVRWCYDIRQGEEELWLTRGLDDLKEPM